MLVQRWLLMSEAAEFYDSLLILGDGVPLQASLTPLYYVSLVFGENISYTQPPSCKDTWQQSALTADRFAARLLVEWFVSHLIADC